MFLQLLYTYSKTRFILLIAFIIIFIYINYKWGVTASPIYQFGMYSGIMKTNDTQNVYHLYINNQLFDASKVNFLQRDFLFQSIRFYKNEKVNNSNVFFTINKLFYRIVPSSLWNIEILSNNIKDIDFAMWYKNILEGYLNCPVNRIEIFSQKYIWKSNEFVPITFPQKELAFAN